MQVSDPSTLSSQERPYFSALWRGGRITTDGVENCQLGHRLDLGGRHGPDGIFVEWSWDGDALTVRNDRYGIYPLFYACHAGEIRISPSILHVLRGDFPKTLNVAALAVFLRLGFFLQEDTPFEHVHLLPPGSTLTWRQGKLTLRRGSMDVPVPETPVTSFDEAVEQYGQLFRQAISRRPPPASGFTLPISGGRDSRHILFELLEQGHKPDLTVTVQSRPPSSNEDLRIARILARELELVHEEIAMPRSYFQANLKDIEVTHFCGSGHTWLLPVAAYLKANGTKTVYDGLAGDVLSGGLQANENRLSLIKSGQTRNVAISLTQESGLTQFLQSSLKDTPRRILDETLAVERIDNELKTHLGAANPWMSFIFWNRTRRGIGLIPFSILSPVETVYCPYLDHELFDFFWNLDPTYSMGNALHDETIRRSYPQHAHLPFEDKHAPRATGAAESAFYRRGVAEFLAHYMSHPRRLRSRLVKSERIVAMLARDLMRMQCPSTWYLQPSLYLMELEEQLDRL
ncbi:MULTISPECIES: asparagine synthetase B family protein [unclassified Ectothiorhodospira]|uniref:asparagine synthase-related protein n=1 Tax=unclassified Ectothiorhodospira TaxID=2684909 RepID=UPI001EE8ED89|nr:MULTISPECIES: asparagine synthetase B family protein [unclassified Ectothiorhodospira]MCG5517095.1 asparagine synthase [Ectothiorhodospira sp. 9100]MCG5519757.1 asparagine synthase [Ectothiorhodospira sp. 9905]